MWRKYMQVQPHNYRKEKKRMTQFYALTSENPLRLQKRLCFHFPGGIRFKGSVLDKTKVPYNYQEEHNLISQSNVVMWVSNMNPLIL